MKINLWIDVVINISKKQFFRVREICIGKAVYVLCDNRLHSKA